MNEVINLLCFVEMPVATKHLSLKHFKFTQRTFAHSQVPAGAHKAKGCLRLLDHIYTCGEI